MHIPRSPSSSRQAGLSLIEVLMAVLLVSVGLLGAAGMHVRAIQFGTDTERRQMASMVASELMETMRGDTLTILQADGTPKGDLGGYAKAKGTGVEAAAGDCQPLAAAPAKRLGCWGLRAKQLMPELPDDLVTSDFAVGLDAASGVIAITVAWPVKKGQCLDGTENEFCTFTLRSRL
ncbi:type IV pilus modification protein PilV [Variovorax sp. ZS18.2.2]|uniref:type IV pilus modification protein PilV n=1 Tax=Variovorax sp. ZS18.2.2 TaxID=2971255 RepID=UPI0021511631|nr:type IV pilus modification protein PilV [Variovorax sp. ZS18.2.2]MCR6479084.1 type IV pilus modification protein PilV [Variovorax sp. ZS18.2.2]